MIPLKETESSILKVIRECQEKYRNSPNIAEIARTSGRHYGTVRTALYRLQAKGYVDLEYFGRQLMIVPLMYE